MLLSAFWIILDTFWMLLNAILLLLETSKLRAAAVQSWITLADAAGCSGASELAGAWASIAL